MASLKQHGFTIGFIACVLLLGAMAWFLVWKPISDLRNSNTLLEKKKGEVENFVNAEVLPTPEYREEAAKKTAEIKNEFVQAVETFAKRGARFQRFFDEAKRAPDSTSFQGQYNDRLIGSNGLRETYRQRFKIGQNVGEEEDEDEEASQMPIIETLEASEFTEEGILRGMKQVWIAEAIFEACNELDIGGLREIKFVDMERVRSRRGKTAAKEEEEKDPKPELQFEVIETLVKVRMPYGKLQEFLVRLTKNDRVPFLEPEELSYLVVEEELKEFGSLARVFEYDTEQGAKSVEESYSKLVTEPPVEVDLRLRVLDWKGVEMPPEESEDDEEEDEEDED